LVLTPPTSSTTSSSPPPLPLTPRPASSPPPWFPQLYRLPGLVIWHYSPKSPDLARWDLYITLLDL
jgi:hypothetical protein